MSGSRLPYPLIRFPPGFSAVLATADTTFIGSHGIVPPHFRTRQVVRVAVHAPGAPSHLRIEHHPISRVHPFPGNTCCGTCPRTSVILAAKKPDVGVGNKLPFRIERIEMYSVSIGDIESGSCPSVSRSPAGIYCVPVRASIRCQHGSAEIGSIDQVRVLVGYS